MRIKVLSLDFDGTLAHHTLSTINIYYEVIDGKISLDELQEKFRLFEQDYLDSQPELRNALRSFGKLTPEDSQKLFSRWNYERLKFVLPDLQESERLEILQKINDRRNRRDKPELFPDVKNNIKYIRGLGLSLNILSGNKQKIIKDLLVEIDLDNFFDNILTPDSLQMDKKDLFSYYTSFSKKVNLAEVLHIGDEPEFDYHIPKSWGMNALWLKRPKNIYLDSAIPESDKISSLDELKIKLENL